MVSYSSKELDGLDVMVANAGIIGPTKPITELSMEEWEQVQQVNLRGVFMCYKWAAKHMIAQGRRGRIIGASSMGGKQGAPNLSSYIAAKFGVRGLTQAAGKDFNKDQASRYDLSVALELGIYGITVNAYAPAQSILADPSSAKQVLATLPSFAKVGQPEDVASIVSYLASKEAHHITGQTISVNAGMYFD
ncbi:hypothetical protein D9757_013665 [Collybiopsis confluens]|nr:hypothetical protein D9757_013665 [Collybiopsis confluens]